MSELKSRVEASWKEAMRNRDAVRRDTLSMVRAAIKNVEIEGRGDPSAGELDDAAVQQVIEREAKRRREAIDEFTRGNRPEKAAQEQAELAVLQEYLPAQMPEDELEKVIHDCIAEVGAQGAADLGKVMKAALPRLAGKADGKRINSMARGLLS